MKITRIQGWRIAPPHDVWHLLSITTASGLVGWGEFTGSGHDAAAAAICRESAMELLGGDALDLEACLLPYRRFRYPPLDDKIAAVAWSAIAQALWDIRAQAFGQPLCRLLGGTPRAVQLYANLNRGLFRNRSPEAHADHAAQALAGGFAAAKCTPFDEVTPAAVGTDSYAPAMARLRAAAAAVDSGRIAIDCHCRFTPAMADAMLRELETLGRFAWIEDIIQPCHHGRMPELRHNHPETIWGGGEETVRMDDALALLGGDARPDIFMPDIKYVCGLDDYAAITRAAEARGCRIYPHNPSGPVSLAFSAHMATLSPDSMVEYPFMAVTGQAALCSPYERVENGRYHLDDRPGLGVGPSPECLAGYGKHVFDATL